MVNSEFQLRLEKGQGAKARMCMVLNQKEALYLGSALPWNHNSTFIGLTAIKHAFFPFFCLF